MLKRLLACALACTVLISALPRVEAASETVPDAYKNDTVLAEAKEIEFADGIEYGPEDNVFHISASQVVRPLSLFSGSARNFYDLLNGTEKLAYDMIKKALQSDLTVSIVDMDGITDVNAMLTAYCAFIADHPEYFWLFGASYGAARDGDGNIVELDIRFGYCYGYSASNIVSRYNSLMNVVNKVVSDANKYTTDYEKIKYFATYISEKMKYNTNAANKGDPTLSSYANCWNAYGALIDGSGVCEAYAEAFKLLCDTAGIPCISVYSNDHEWNAVKLDGNWYYVDVTWIDTDNKSTYQYAKWLAVGTSTAKKNDNAAGSHTPVNTNIILSGVNLYFTYPDISTADYEPVSDPDITVDLINTGGSGSTGSAGGSTAKTTVQNKTVASIGSAKYTFTATVASPVIDVSVPTGIAAVINPYGVAITTKDGNSYGAEGIASPVYTIRNKTLTNAVSIGAELYLTVPKDKNGVPSITVYENPKDVKNSTEKALSAYLLAYVSEDATFNADYEDKNLIEANNVTYSAGKTLVFADATSDGGNSSKGTLMVIPKAEDKQDYYYGQYKVSGEVSDNSKADWSSADKFSLTLILDITPCPDP